MAVHRQAWSGPLDRCSSLLGARKQSDCRSQQAPRDLIHSGEAGVAPIAKDGDELVVGAEDGVDLLLRRVGQLDGRSVERRPDNFVQVADRDAGCGWFELLELRCEQHLWAQIARDPPRLTRRRRDGWRWVCGGAAAE